MKTCFRIIPLLGFWVGAATGQVPADTDSLPIPRRYHEEACKKFSNTEFEQLLVKLKSERAALLTEWQALFKRSGPLPKEDASETQLQKQLKEALLRLQESRHQQPKEPREIDLGAAPKIEPLPPPAIKDEEMPPPIEVAEPNGGPVDSLAHAQTLFRTNQYAEALASFRLVDLKGKKAEARVPIQYLMALCLLRLGQNDEAIPLLREVANSRGDEKLAVYAQWHLEMARWQSDVQNRLQEQRQRRLDLEKNL